MNPSDKQAGHELQVKQGGMLQRAIDSISTRLEDHVSAVNFPVALYAKLAIGADDGHKLSTLLHQPGDLYGLDKATLMHASVSVITINKLRNFLRPFQITIE